MPVGGSDFGTLPPAGTSLDLTNKWVDGTYQFRSGSTLQTNSGSTASLAGTTTISGNFTSTGPATLGGTNVNDLSETLAPSSFGLVDWNFPYTWATGTGSAATTAGTLYLTKIPMAGGTKVTNLWFKIATAASGITSGQNFGGIYSSSGSLLATTGDLSTAIGTNTGAIQAPLTSAFTTAAADNFYVGFFFNASVTLPVLSCYTGFVTVTTSVASFGSVTTFGNTAAKYPYAVSATGGNTTALPASITMSSNTATGAYVFWAGVN
jgi:hypothetical protein